MVIKFAPCRCQKQFVEELTCLDKIYHNNYYYRHIFRPATLLYLPARAN